MEARVLNAELRSDAGKGVARKLRAGGRIPAVVYGPGIDPHHISVDSRDLSKIFRESDSENILIDLMINSAKKPLKVLLKHAQLEPVDGSMLHVDFQQIDLTKKIHVNIPIKLTGTAEGVKSQGGVLEFIQRTVEVACLPTEIKDFVEVDVTNLQIGNSIHAGDIKVEGVEMLTSPNQVLILVAAPTIAKVAAAEGEAVEGEGEAAEAAEGAEGEEPKEPEVIREKKQKDKEE